MTKAGVASLRAARKARARVVSTVRSGGGGRISESVLRGYGISQTKTGEYKYYDPARKGYVTTKPAAQVAAEAEAVKTEAAKTKAEYFYQPRTGKMTFRASGEQPRGEGWVSMGAEKPTAYAVRQARGISQIPHTIVEAREPAQRFEPTPRAKQMVEVPTLAEAIKAGQPPVTAKPKYEPTALGGIKLAWAKLKTGPDILWEKAKGRYTPQQMLKGAQDIIKFKEKVKETIKAKEIKDVRIKAKEKIIYTKEKVAKHPLVYDIKQFVGVIPKGLRWAKKEFGPEIKTEAQKLKGIRDWDKDMKKIEGVFLEARKGYVWAEEKAKGLEFKPVKQPAFLKEVDPYKEFRRQTKKQIVGAAQIGKVTMGATAGVVEDIRVKPYKLPLIYAAGVVAGPVASKVLGAGKVAKVAGVGLGTSWAAGIGVEAAMTPSGLAREKLIGVRAAELTAFLSGAKYGIEKKPLAELYKARVREPRFEKQIAKWQKGITTKDLGYREKRAFLPIKDMPQRTLSGEPISPKKIKWLRAEVRPGFYGMDIARYRAEGFETKFFQKHLKDIYTIKAIDLRYPKVVTITPEKMTTFGYRQILGAQPKSFVFKKPPIVHRVDVTKIDKGVQTILAPKVIKVTKYDRPFYLKKPKLPKPVKLSKLKKITPVHLEPEPKPVKIKTKEFPTVSIRPVYVAEPPPPKADVGVVLGTIPKGTALAGAISLGGMRFGAKDFNKALQGQFGVSRQRAEQRQARKLGQDLEGATKQALRQEAKQVAKTKPKVVLKPKVKPVVKVTPVLKQPTKQIPKLRQPVPTIPFFPQPTYPIYEEPKVPIKKQPLPKIPELKWPYGRPPLKGKKKKKPKPFHKYQPSLVALGKKITTREMKMPKYLTGVGIRPVRLKF